MNGSVTGVDNAHGVWQVPPLEVLANAPGGLESIVTTASVSGAGSSLESGMFESTPEQPTSAQPNPTATDTRVRSNSVANSVSTSA